MLVGRLSKFGFRLRKQFEEVLEGRLMSMAHLRQKFGELESLVVTDEDNVLLRKNLMKVKNRYFKLALLEPIQTTLSNTATDEVVFRLFNDVISADMDSIIDSRQLSTIMNIARQLSPHALAHDALLMNYSASKPIIDEVRRRFSFIEEFMCHICFKGYTKLVRSVPIVNPFELDSDKKKTKFKEDFQYAMDQELKLEEAEQVAELLQLFARFGVGNQKVYLLAQLLIAKYFNELNPTAIGQLMFCLAQTKRAVRNVENDVCEWIIAKAASFSSSSMTSIMYYLLVNHITAYTTWEKLSESFFSHRRLTQLESSDAKLAHSLVLSLRSTENLSHLPALEMAVWEDVIRPRIQEQPELKQPSKQQAKLRSFLTRNRYFYKEAAEPYFMGPRVYLTDSNPVNHIIFLDMHRFIRSKEIGLVSLMKEYYHSKSLPLKIVASHQIIDKETRRESDSYFYSKFKGCRRDETPKPLHFSY